jgi:hypothetical protein
MNTILNEKKFDEKCRDIFYIKGTIKLYGDIDIFLRVNACGTHIPNSIYTSTHPHYRRFTKITRLEFLVDTDAEELILSGVFGDNWKQEISSRIIQDNGFLAVDEKCIFLHNPSEEFLLDNVCGTN